MLQTSLRKPVAWNNRYTMSPLSYFNLQFHTYFACLPSDCPVMLEGALPQHLLPNEDTATPRRVPSLAITLFPTLSYVCVSLSLLVVHLLSLSFFLLPLSSICLPVRALFCLMFSCRFNVLAASSPHYLFGLFSQNGEALAIFWGGGVVLTPPNPKTQ